MPTNPTYPGVYIEEIPSGVHTITGVATSIAALFGRTAKGPMNKAVRCFNYSDFTRAFGGAHPSSDLAQSLRQFFNNGGTDCYVVRLAHKPAFADITLLAIDGTTNVLTATAKNAGAWGNGIHLEVDYDTPNPDETFNLNVFAEDGGVITASEKHTNLTMDKTAPRYAPSFVTQSSNIIDLALDTALDLETSTISGYSDSRRPFDATTGTTLHTNLNALLASTGHFELSINGGQYVHIDLSSLTIAHSSGGNFRDEASGDIQSEINTQLGAVIPGAKVLCSWEPVHGNFYLLRITSDSGAKSAVRIVRSTTGNDLTGPMMLGLDQGGIEVVRYSDFRPAPNAALFTGNINTLAALKQSAFTQVDINGAAFSVDLAASGSSLLETTAAADQWYTDNLSSAVNAHNDGIREKLNIIKNEVNKQSGLPCRVELWGYRPAFIPTTASINQAVTIATSGGDNIDISANVISNVRQYTLGTTGTGNFQGNGTVGKDDDGNPPDKNDYVGNKNDQTGFHALDNVDIFNLMVLPGDTDVDFTSILGPASIYCEKARGFLLIDAPQKWTNATTGLPDVVRDTTKIDTLRASVTKKSSAVFYPRLKYKSNGLNRLIGASGAIAGLMARTDAARGVWKAPAGTDADIRGILGLEVKLTDMQNGVLNQKAVNCIREFPGSYVCWGARTLAGYDNTSEEDWKYIPVRRLTLFLEESLFRGTKWVVFEPNDDPLWAKIRLNVGAFMMRLFKQGAFQGSTPDKAFYVKCDGETTPQADINLGIVNIEVGFAPLKPAEFVIIKIQQMVGEL